MEFHEWKKSWEWKTRGFIEVVLKDKNGAKIQRLTCAKRRFAQFASQTAFSTGTLYESRRDEVSQTSCLARKGKIIILGNKNNINKKKNSFKNNEFEQLFWKKEGKIILSIHLAFWFEVEGCDFKIWMRIFSIKTKNENKKE